MQFLHQCHLSKSLPLTYSTIQTIPNKHYVTTDICHCRLLSNLAKLIGFQFFASRTSRGALIFPVSFPDVKGALTPTVTAAFVDAAPTLWRVKISALTHKTFSIDYRCRGGFLPFYYKSQTSSLSFNFKHFREYFLAANKFGRDLG